MKASYIIKVEWDKLDRLLTSQMIRDKILTPLQELWITHTINKFTLEEIGKGNLEREDTKGERRGTSIKHNK